MKPSTEVTGIIVTILIGIFLLQGCAALKQRREAKQVQKDVYDMVVYGIKDGTSCEILCMGIRGYFATKGIKIP